MIDTQASAKIMDPNELSRKKERAASKRAFDIGELARRLDLTAEVAAAMYDRATGDMVRAVTLAKEEGLVPNAVGKPPISAVGRKA